MSKYHINRETGDPGLCRATQGKCPFGGEAEHYDSPLKAREAYEKSQSGSFLTRSKGFARRLLVVGGLSVAAVSIAGCTSIATQHDSGPTIGPADTPEVSQPVDQSWIDKADEFVNDHPVTTPSEEEIESWLKEKQDKLNKWLSENGGSTPETNPLSYEADGIYFQGRSLSVTPDEVAQAEDTLASLVTKPAVDDGGYDRNAQFGRGFVTGMAGAIEHRDVPNATFRNDSPQARVVTGSFIDPYTGQPVQVTGGDSFDASIDHLVPLKEAYISGAADWTQEQRKDFANDMDNLVYTAFSVNSSKGSKDAASWLPSYEPSQCIYAVKVIQVKGSYNLSVDSAEKAALQQIINTKCE